MSRQRAKTAVRREQIARAALELVARGGLRAFSMVKVARRVGIAPSAIYRHFAGKDDVLLAALERFRETVLDNVAAVRRETPRSLERLSRLVARQARLIRRNATIMPRLAFAEDSAGVASHARDRVAGVLGGFLDAVADIVREGQRAGEVRRDVPADVAALMLFGLLMPAGLLWHLRRGRFDVARHVTAGWRTLRRALAAPQRKRASPGRRRS